MHHLYIHQLKNQQFKLYLCIALVVMCWGYSPVGVHMALQSYSPEHIALMRFWVASLILLLVVLKKGIMPLRFRDIPILMILGFFAVTCHHLLINMGQKYVTAMASSILCQSIPLFTLLISAWVFKDRITSKQALCIILGLAGAVLVVSGEHGLSIPDLHGVLILLAALSWTIYFVLYKKSDLSYDSLSLMCYVIWFGTIPLLFYSSGLMQELRQSSWQANSAILALGIFPSALAYLLWGYVLKYLPLTTASNYLYCTPLVAISIAMIFLGERLSGNMFWGGGMVLLSIFLLNKSA